jgi:hypothetical protein
MENSKEIYTENSDTESIFKDEEFSLEGYDKNIRQARNTLFTLSALQFILGIFILFTSPGKIGWISFTLTTFMAVIFLALGFWTKAKPYSAIICALLIYILLWVGDSILDPAYIYKGILVKIIVIVYLAKGLKDAKEAQTMKAIMGC